MSGTIRGHRFLQVGVSLLVCGALRAVAAAEDDPFAAARQLFMREYAAIESGTPLPSAADSAALRAYPLYPYLQRARLVRALGRAVGPVGTSDDQARAFLAAHGGMPVAAELRRAWLRSLAARSQWDMFLAEYEPATADSALRCQWLNARIAQSGDAGARAAAVEQWLTPERLPPECERAFEWLRVTNAMTDALVEQRAALLLRNGQTAFARLIANRLPQERAAPLLQWADLLDQPRDGLDALLADRAGDGVDDVVLLQAWRKLARSEPRAALERYGRLRRVVGHDDARMGPYALALALGLAWDREAEEALRVFRDVPAADLDDIALAWQARAALWAGEWRQVERSIEAMSPGQKHEPRWRYWSARAAAARGQEETAVSLYASVLPSDNFYAASAAARLGVDAVPHPETLGADEATLADLATMPAFLRARELLLVGLRGPAFSEWQAGIEALDEIRRLQAIHLASRWQWHDVSVSTATRQRVFFDYALLYPRPFEAEVQAAAAFASLGAPLVYAVVRQESLFRADAVSSAGAMGLAQILPETARTVARNRRQPTPKAADLLEPSVNLPLGAAYLRDLLDAFEQQAIVALAGYNAGPRAAERWLPPRPIDADIWIENIPYNETREYVQRVLWHHVVFTWLETGRGESFRQWLRVVAPIEPRKAADDAAASAG